MKLVLSAGGQGTKLWPYSRSDKPKQFQNILHGQSLFAYNAYTLLSRFPAKDIFVSTKQKYIEFVKEQVPELMEENFIIEPNVAKNRGPSEGYVALVLSLQHPTEPFMLIQTDDIRLPQEKFLDMIEEMEKLVNRDRKFITGGIVPQYPVLGVDYLSLGEKVNTNATIVIHKITEFVARVGGLEGSGGIEDTKKLIKNNNAVIHCNHSCWFPDLWLEAYKNLKPNWYQKLMEIREVLKSNPQNMEKIESIYTDMEAGMTEQVTSKVMPEGYAVLLPFKWVDIGAWNSVYEHFAEDGDLYKQGNVVALDSKSSILMSDNPKKLIAAFGLENMVVVDTEDILLIVPKDKVDGVKDIQKQLKENSLDKYL